MKTNYLSALFCTLAISQLSATIQSGTIQSKETFDKKEALKEIPEIQQAIKNTDPVFYKTIPNFVQTGSDNEEEKYIIKVTQKCEAHLNTTMNTPALEKAIAYDSWNNRALAQIGFKIISQKTKSLLLAHGKELLSLAQNKKISELNEKLLEETRHFDFLKPCIWVTVINVIYASLCAVDGKLKTVRPNFISEYFAERQQKNFHFFVFKDTWLTRTDKDKLACASEVVKKMAIENNLCGNDDSPELMHEILYAVKNEYDNIEEELDELISWVSTASSIQ